MTDNNNMSNEMLKRIYDELISLHDFYNDLKDEDGLRNVNYLLDELDKNIGESLKGKKVGPIMTTHDFLNYFCQRYNIEYLEPIEPIPGKEPSPKDILKLHRLVKEKDLKVLFSEPQLNTQNAKNLAESAGIKYLDLDPIGADKSIKDYKSLILWNLNQMLAGH